MQAAEHALVDQVEDRGAGAVVAAEAGAEVEAHSQVAGGGGDVPHVAGLLGSTQVRWAPAGQSVRIG